MEIIEKIFESALWKTRFLIMFAVIFGLIGGLILFIVASLDIWHVLQYTFSTLINGLHPKDFHSDIIIGIIGAVDLYLIAVVMLLFSFGLYELFISEIDIAKNSECSQILTITSLDQLKDKIAKVIIMVLIVNFFQRVMHIEFKGALEMLYLAGSILALALGLYYLNKKN
jgi:uncharacterized protein (TIGR00645 family)